GESLLVLLGLFFELGQLGERSLAVALDNGALRRIGAVHEVGSEGIDAALQRVGVRLVAVERLLEPFEAACPIGLVLSRLVGLGVLLVFRVFGAFRVLRRTARCRSGGLIGAGGRWRAGTVGDGPERAVAD